MLVFKGLRYLHQEGISAARWNAMLKFAQTKINVRDAARKRDGVYTV